VEGGGKVTCAWARVEDRSVTVVYIVRPSAAD